MMRLLALESLAGLLTVSLSAGCTQAPVGSQPRELPVVAVHQTTSWEDRGLKAIVFPDGVAFVMRADSDSAASPDFFTMQKALLSQADQKLLIEVIERHHFFDLPAAMQSRVCDGSGVYVLCADATREHWVYSYHSENPDFRAFETAFWAAVSRSVATADHLSATEFLEGIATDIEKLPKDSLSKHTAATWLDYLVRYAPPALRRENDLKRFTLPGDGARWFRDVRKDELEEFPDVMVPERNAAAEAPVVVDDFLSDLGPTVVEVPLPDLDPIVLEVPALER